MIEIDLTALESVLDGLPARFKGPGGVAGVVKNGKVIARRAWGYADLGARLAMTATTLLPICSISKQFTCGLLLDQIAEPSRLDAAVAKYLPNFRDLLPTVRQLCDNQSGLRDYWALTVLHGAFPEQEFRREDALPLLARMKTGHFAPGTRYSYCNNNFRILGELIEADTGIDLSDLLADRIFGPAGMTSAQLRPDTRANADGVVGYEGNDDVGFLAAQNGIYWIGDAGISASLDDMLAWEVFIDATRNDPSGLYNRLSDSPTFRDGEPAAYRNGLSHAKVAGFATTGHGGAIRGFRAHRRHMASERLSAVVMFNHEGDAHAAAIAILEAAQGFKAPAETPGAPEWNGLWLDAEQGMVLRTVATQKGVTLHYASGPSTLQPDSQNGLTGDGVTLTRQGSDLLMWREGENLAVTAQPLAPMTVGSTKGLAGAYWSDELEAGLMLDARDGAIFAGFDGMLGTGPMERMYIVAADIWVITSRRSMDASAPGDWTVLVQRGVNGEVTGLNLGCWLARNIHYRRVL